MKNPPAEVTVEQRDREAAAVVFDALARRASHPQVAMLNRHYAKVIRAGEGDGYDAVQAAAISRHRTEAQTDAGGWRGIESAPRVHGTRILATNRYGVVEVVCWNDAIGWWDDGFYDRDDVAYPEPKVWQPVPLLPATPDLQRDGQEGEANVSKIEIVAPDAQALIGDLVEALAMAVAEMEAIRPNVGPRQNTRLGCTCDYLRRTMSRARIEGKSASSEGEGL